MDSRWQVRYSLYDRMYSVVLRVHHGKDSWAWNAYVPLWGRDGNLLGGSDGYAMPELAITAAESWLTEYKRAHDGAAE